LKIVECLNAQGNSPFQQWFYSLDPQAAAIVTTAIERLADGNTSRVKSIGEAHPRFGSIAVQAIEFTSAGMARRSSCCLAGAPSAAKDPTSPRRWRYGGSTKRAK
jgi:hypothetical protein